MRSTQGAARAGGVVEVVGEKGGHRLRRETSKRGSSLVVGNGGYAPNWGTRAHLDDAGLRDYQPLE